MDDPKASGAWRGGADVCVAAVEAGRTVDRFPDSYAPDVQLWVPEASFVRIAEAAAETGLWLGDVRAALRGEQVRLSPDACAPLLAGWAAVEEAVADSPADGWAAANGDWSFACAVKAASS